MNFSIIRRALSEIRQQPLVGALSIFGTAFAVFLAMIVMMTSQVKSVPFAPESCRDNLFIGRYFHEAQIEGQSASSSGLSSAMARKLYGGLEGVDTIALLMQPWEEETLVSNGSTSILLRHKLADGAFWTVFDHTFIAGRPYSDGAVESGIPEVVLTRSAAAELLGLSPDDALGRIIVMGDREATVVGIVEDHTPLASYAYGDIFGPYTAFPSLSQDGSWSPHFGATVAAILAKPGTTADQLKEQVRERYRRLEAEMKPENLRPIYHGGPLTLGEAISTQGSNSEAEDTSWRTNLVIYLMLILVPAINLSSITNSRLRHRTSEIGVRRAFGAHRSRIFAELLAENFVVTLIGASIGLLLSFGIAWLCSDMLFHISDYGISATFSPLILINWPTVGFAVLIAFVLNILSTFIPAIHAARVNPVEAIAGRRN